MRANPISGYLNYVTSVTKTCEGCCATGHDVSQGTLKEVMCRGTQFQDTANIIEKIYPKRLSELKASSNSHRPLFLCLLSFRERYLPQAQFPRMSLLGFSVNKERSYPYREKRANFSLGEQN